MHCQGHKNSMCLCILPSSLATPPTCTRIVRFLNKLYHWFILALSWTSWKISVNELFVKELCPFEKLIIYTFWLVMRIKITYKQDIHVFLCQQFTIFTDYIYGLEDLRNLFHQSSWLNIQYSSWLNIQYS